MDSDTDSRIASLEASLAAAQEAIAELQDALSGQQQTTRRVQNYGSSGTTSPLGGSTNVSTSSQPPSTKSGVTIPYVQNVKASLISYTAGRANVSVSWTDVPDPTGIIEYYNVWIVGSITGQNQETLVASTHLSPATFSIPQGVAGTVGILVQTQYKGGRANDLQSVPSTTLNLGAPQINATDLNVNGFFFGPGGTLTLSGFTWSNGPGTSVSWSAGVASYQGVSYNVTAGQCNAPNFLIEWQLSAPTVFTSATSPTAMGVNDFIVGANTSVGNPGVQGFFSPVVEIHNLDGGTMERVIHTSDGMIGYNASSSNPTFTLTRSGSDTGGAVAGGVLRLFDGTAAGSLGAGQRAILQSLDPSGLTLATTASAPSTNAGGGTIYIAAGALTYKGAAGTVTTIAPS